MKASCSKRLQEEAASAVKDAAQHAALSTQHAHACREAEKRLEKCRAQLATSVSREERTLARNREVYGRVRSAWAATKGGGRAPGAVAAAARELRPVEIVGIFEHHKAETDLEIARLSGDNDALRADLRRAENEALLMRREVGGTGAASLEVRPWADTLECQ